MHTTLLNRDMLAQHLDDPAWVIVDCRFSLADTGAGYRAYQEGHIPNAVYAHLDDDLSGPPVTNQGRHPMPTPAALIELFGRLSINNQRQVVVYDDANGAIASRLWWMLRYMKHEAVAVLDGGWQAWLAAGLPTQAGVNQPAPALFQGEPRSDLLVTADQLSEASLLVDSRDGPRYRGEQEPIDPVAGHIPGAVNYFYQQNWTEDGRYRPVAEMTEQLKELLGDSPAGDTVFYCGSGVTACVNLLAMAHAGLGDGRLYGGSWSDWIHDPARPIAR
jgi:thiosulfate/3-mercaptopyruvate sulfurtransferase